MRVEVPEICYHATEDIMPMLSLDVHATPAVGLAPPITRLATAGGDHTVRVWALTDAPDSTAAAAATAGAAVPAAVATNGGAAPAAAAVGRSRTQLTFLAELKHDKSINAVKFSPDGKRIATGGDGQRRILDIVMAALESLAPVGGLNGALMRTVLFGILLCVTLRWTGAHLATH